MLHQPRLRFALFANRRPGVMMEIAGQIQAA